MSALHRAKRPLRKRLLRTTGAVALVAGASTLAFGVTFGLFSAARPSQTNSFASGTVTLTTAASTECDVGTGNGESAGALFPGNSSTGFSSAPGAFPTCTFDVAYGGSIPGYMGVDVLIATESGTLPIGVPPGTTAKPLFDGTPDGLQLQLHDTTNGTGNFFINGTNYSPQGTTPPPSTAIPSVTCPSAFTGYICYQANNLLVSTTAFVNGGTNTFSLEYQLPNSSTSGYENSTAVVVLTAHAVQASNNAIPATCHALVQCTTNFHWS